MSWVGPQGLEGDESESIPKDILARPFAEWPSKMRRAYLEGWARKKIGVGKSAKECAYQQAGSTSQILVMAAWEMGNYEAGVN